MASLFLCSENSYPIKPVFRSLYMHTHNPWKPLVYFSLVAFGLLLGVWLKPQARNGSGVMDELLNLAENYYVDTVNSDQLRQLAVEGILAGLDPHSVYIPNVDVETVNEPLEGSFDGIGVEFNIIDDTVMVVAPIHGGVSQQLGILSGDRIVQVDSKNIAGIKITNDQVMKLLKGKRGTTVKVGIYRRGNKRLIPFTIKRDKIPIYSVDAGYMLNEQTGYIKISRFAATTFDEFREKLIALNKPKNLILDLRGNPGGYLQAATQIADELIDGKKLIVYTEGRHQNRQEYFAEKTGRFESGKLVLLIDEGSASASEILAGAVQDQDRGTIVGRRSFGKGLVQETVGLSDGSELRLTVARYYTPSGRCIQKPYNGKSDAYENEVYDRIEHGELSHPDSSLLKDKKAFKTAKGRTVYAGGGIMPDVFVGIDSGRYSDYYRELVQQGILLQFAYTESDRSKNIFDKSKTFEAFEEAWLATSVGLILRLNIYAKSKGLQPAKLDEATATGQVKAMIARQHFGETGYSRVHNQTDPFVKKALEGLGK